MKGGTTVDAVNDVNWIQDQSYSHFNSIKAPNYILLLSTKIMGKNVRNYFKISAAENFWEDEAQKCQEFRQNVSFSKLYKNVQKMSENDTKKV